MSRNQNMHTPTPLSTPEPQQTPLHDLSHAEPDTLSTALINTKHFKRADRLRYCNMFQSSQCSAVQFCKEHRLPVNNFRSWLRNYIPQQISNNTPLSDNTQSGFSRLTVKSSTAIPPSPITAHLQLSAHVHCQLTCALPDFITLLQQLSTVSA